MYRVDSGHRGWAPDERLVPPLERRWTRSFPAASGHVVYGDGRIYVTSRGTLHALSPRTGRDIWTTAGASERIAYADGRVFATIGGQFAALNAADGSVLWARSLPHGSLPGHPVPEGGTVYVTGSYSELVAMDVASGEVRWTRGDTGNGTTTPATDGVRVYEGRACYAAAWQAADGSSAWRSAGDCASGGSSSMPVLYRDRLYITHHDRTYASTDGTRLGDLPGTGPPAFAGDFGVFHRPGALWVTNLKSGERAWNVRLRDQYGNPTTLLDESLLIAGGTVYRADRGTSGLIRAHTLQTGTYVWEDLPPRAPGEEAAAQLAAAPGLLLVSTGKRLTAYRSVFRPRPRAVGFGTYATDIFLGERAVMVGVMGRALRDGPPPARIESDSTPFGRFRELERHRFEDDGWFGFIERPLRNTRYRAAVKRSRSRAVTIYAYPRFRIKLRALSRTTFRTTVRFGGARGVRLAGRRGYVYYARRNGGMGRRLGWARIRQRGGAVRYSVTARSPRSRRGFIVVCIHRQSRIGLGRPLPLLKHCGRRRVRTP